MEVINLDEPQINTDLKKSNSTMTVVVGLALLLVAGGLFSVWSLRNNQSQSGPSNQSIAPTPQVQGSTDGMALDDSVTPVPSDVKTFSVQAGSFYYNPAEIRVKKGDKVRIVMESVDMMHDFNIDELNVKIPVTQSGSTAVVEFVADQAGEFEYYCSVGQHRKNGQVGKLIVE